MAITRAQIPEQIDIFNEGGEANSTTAQANDLTTLLSQFGTYEENLKKYQSRLAPFQPTRKKMSIYDFASELGAGLAATPNTGDLSTFVGLGLGFNRVSDRLRAAEVEEEQARQQIGLKAAELAMQDEQKALEFLQDYEMKNLEYANKRGDLLTFQWQENGETKTKTVRDNIANDSIIQGYLDKGAVEIDPSKAVTNITVGGGASDERNKEAIKRQIKAEEEIFSKRKAAVSSMVNIDEAVDIAKRLGPENFGAVAKLTLYPRKLLSAIGVTDDNQENIIGDQILLSQISMGFTMDIVSRTKGAISNREMELFISASPGLGSNYNGFMKQAEYLRRVAKRDKDFADAYAVKADELEDLAAKGEISDSQVTRQLDLFETDWYDRTYFDKSTDSFITGETPRENLIFSAEEAEELRKIKAGGYVDEDNFEYINEPEGFNPDLWQKKYREGQEATANQSSTYSLNKNPAIDSLNRRRQSIQARSDLTEQEKNELFAAIDKQIKALQQ